MITVFLLSQVRLYPLSKEAAPHAEEDWRFCALLCGLNKPCAVRNGAIGHLSCACPVGGDAIPARVAAARGNDSLRRTNMQI